MKRLHLLGLVGGGLLAFSCSDDKNGGDTSSGTQTSGTVSMTSTSTSSVGGASSSSTTATTTTTTTAPGGTGGTGGSTTGGEAGAGGDFVAPTWLSETGLYEEDMQTLAEGVMDFEPQYLLWSDTADKRRWVKLPPDAQIDTSDMDYWVYPVGTQLFKEFTRDNIRIETRLLQKIGEDEWFMVAFQWNEEQTDAEAKPGGWFDASGTEHDIPSENQCINCHDKMPDISLGFTALQLSHDKPGVTLDQLVSEGRLSHPPDQPLAVPGDDTEREALGYLHANCGNCHNPRSFVSSMVDMQLWLPVSSLDAVASTPSVETTVNRAASAVFFQGAGGEGGQSSFDTRIVPGDADSSVLFLRMANREVGSQMPPIGTELVDETGTQLIRAWIEGMPASE